MFTRIINIIIVVCFLFVSFSYADTLNDKDYKEGEVFIRFAPKQNGQSRTMSEKQTFVKSKLGNARIKKQYDIVSDLTLVELPAGVKVADAITNLKNDKDILYIEPNYRLYAMAVPNDPYFPNLWGMHNTGQSFPTEGGSTDYGTLDADIDAPEAWDIHTDASNIIVAVIDTGIDYTHPDLAANMWVNQAKIWNRKLRNCGYVLSKCFFRRKAAGFSPFDEFGNINAAIGCFAVVNIALRLT